MLSDLYIRLRSLFRRARVEKELDEELNFHLDRQAHKYLQAGMSRKEAMRRVRLEFGGIEQVKKTAGKRGAPHCSHNSHKICAMR